MPGSVFPPLTPRALPRDPGRWRYVLDQPFYFRHHLLDDISWECPWAVIADGVIKIRAGYAWDGCSPAIRLPGGIWIGPPDGPRGSDGLPAAFHASLVHDVLCQYANTVPLGADAVSQVFYDLLRIYGASAWRARLYQLAVLVFGPSFGGDEF